MRDDQRAGEPTISGPVRRDTATVLSSPAPFSCGGGVRSACAKWFDAESRLEALTLAWSQAEAQALGRPPLSDPKRAAAQMRRLDTQIARLDRERGAWLNLIAALPATSPAEAVDKLLVARRLLEGEGGAEHAIVADAVRSLATELDVEGRGLNGPRSNLQR